MKQPVARGVAARVLDVIRQTPGSTAQDIAQRLYGPTAEQQQVNSYCVSLCEAGLVSRNKQGRAYRYFPCPLVQEDELSLPQQQIDDSSHPSITAGEQDPAPLPPTQVRPINLAAQVVNLRLVPVYCIKKCHWLVRGGKRDNLALCTACDSVKAQNICYYWKAGDRILYIGSATKRGNERVTLLSRVRNYLQTHSKDKVNQNKRVFSNINKQLAVSDVELGRFEFDLFTVRDFTISYDDCTGNPHATRMLEALLIGYFRLQAQVPWNL